MKTTITHSLSIILIGGITFMTSCKKDKNVYAEDFSVTMDENPASGYEIGTIDAKTEKSYLTYTLISESVTGALNVDSKTGMLTVKDRTLFNYEINPVITAEVEASNGKRDAISNVTITLNDVYEVPAVIGDFRDGGIVFWVNPEDNNQGMVCTLVDITTSNTPWGCWDIYNSVLIDGANGTAVGTGAQNTIDIIEGCSETASAAYICSSLSLNSYVGWFLPSMDEMTEMYNNKAAINAEATANGGDAFDEGVLYWTSTQASADKAYDFDFGNGNSTSTLKLNYFSVRAVREF